MRNGSASLGNFREEFHLINDPVQGVCNTRKFQNHWFEIYRTWFPGYVPTFRKKICALFALYSRSPFYRAGPSVHLSAYARNTPRTVDGFFKYMNWVFLMTLVDILRFLSQRRWNNMCINKIQQDATVCRCLFTAKLLYMFRLSIAPIIRITSKFNSSFWYSL